MSNQADHTIVRLRVPPELKKQIEESAEKNNRSQSAEMVARLEQSFDQAEDCELKAQISHLEGVIKGYDSAIKKLTDEFFNKKNPKHSPSI